MPLRLFILAVVSLLIAGCASEQKLDRGVVVQEARLEAGVYFTDDGERLPFRAYAAGPNPRAIVVALHGFNDYSRFIEDAARYFALAGIYTVAYDQRGFGLSTGRGRWHGTDALVRDLRTFLSLVRKDYPMVPLFVLGESMGGAVASKALADGSESLVDGVILSSPAVWSRDAMPWYQRAGLWLLVRIAPAMTLSGKGVRIEPSDNMPMRIELSRDPLVIKESRVDALAGLVDLMDDAVASLPRLRQRMLFLYGERDEVIPAKPVIRVLEAMSEGFSSDTTFSLYSRGYHMLLRDMQRQVVQQDVAAWIIRRATRLPSGEDIDRVSMIERLSGNIERLKK